MDLSSIPESMDEMIAAQIDALPPDLQLLLKMCAVFGRVVDCRCIRKVWGIYGARKQRKRRKSMSALVSADKTRRAKRADERSAAAAQHQAAGQHHQPHRQPLRLRTLLPSHPRHPH